MKQISNAPFMGTEKQEKELMGWIAAHKGEKGIAMNALQKAQEIYGYLPLEIQKLVSRELGTPLSELYGIATFYSMFNLAQKGKHQINVCMGTACYVKGNAKVFEELEGILGIKGGGSTKDGKFSLDACRCIGACGLAPAIMIDEEVFGRLTGDKGELEAILSKY
ncbi:MAG: NAD(P)H-dependent oxidoreductase subunit E [Clostridiales Family XIII bacterium]|jgi:NADH:ubiquinone oxidoreductase subunit E|nr:NAD(P)H-dependent oxidoreductase subunit E [Clostridiales Family XIII bacterium]